MDNGVDVLCPPASSLALRVNLPSIFNIKSMCVSTYLNPGLTFPSLILFCVTPFKNSKTTRKLSIYFSIDFLQKVVLVFWSVFVCLVNRLRNLNPKHMCCSTSFCFYPWDNLILFAKNIIHPPFKGRFILYVVCYWIFSEFNRVWGFDILQRY